MSELTPDQKKMIVAIEGFEGALGEGLEAARRALAKGQYQAASEVLTGLTQAMAKLSVGVRSHLLKQKLIQEKP